MRKGKKNKQPRTAARGCKIYESINQLLDYPITQFINRSIIPSPGSDR